MSDLTELPEPNGSTVSLDIIIALSGKDVAMLSDSEKLIYRYAHEQGRRLGISISTISEAPNEALALATSKEHWDEVNSDGTKNSNSFKKW